MFFKWEAHNARSGARRLKRSGWTILFSQ